MGFLSVFNPISAASSFRRFVPALLNAASLICFASVPAAQAETFVPAFRFNTTTTNFDESYLLGYHFKTDMDKVIKAIGVYNTISSPTSNPNNSLGIWDFSDLSKPPKLLFQTIISTKGDCSDPQFCWYPVSDFPSLNPNLTKNTDYVIATAWGTEKVPAFIEPDDVFIISSGFNVGENAFFQYDPLPDLDVDLTLYTPDQTNKTYKKAFFTANLSFETFDSVQIPSPLPVIGAAAAFGWSRKIRRRISSTS
jgi:hypothetical protein